MSAGPLEAVGGMPSEAAMLVKKMIDSGVNVANMSHDELIGMARQMGLLKPSSPTPAAGFGEPTAAPAASMQGAQPAGAGTAPTSSPPPPITVVITPAHVQASIDEVTTGLRQLAHMVDERRNATTAAGILQPPSAEEIRFNRMIENRMTRLYNLFEVGKRTNQAPALVDRAMLQEAFSARMLPLEYTAIIWGEKAAEGERAARSAAAAAAAAAAVAVPPPRAVQQLQPAAISSQLAPPAAGAVEVKSRPGRKSTKAAGDASVPVSVEGAPAVGAGGSHAPAEAADEQMGTGVPS